MSDLQDWISVTTIRALGQVENVGVSSIDPNEALFQKNTLDKNDHKNVNNQFRETYVFFFLNVKKI